MKTKISLSILSINNKPINYINKKLKELNSRIDAVHLDPMDGKFVNNKNIIPISFIKKLKTSKRKEFHLMVKNPEVYIKKYSKIADLIFVHLESTKNIENCIKLANKNKSKIGLVIKPETKPSKLMPYLDKIDAVMIMTVNPGKSGQKFIKSTLKKVKYIRKINKKINIYADGGINNKTARLAIKAGANNLVIGSYLLRGD